MGAVVAFKVKSLNSMCFVKHTLHYSSVSMSLLCFCSFFLISEAVDTVFTLVIHSSWISLSFMLSEFQRAAAWSTNSLPGLGAFSLNTSKNTDQTWNMSFALRLKTIPVLIPKHIVVHIFYIDRDWACLTVILNFSIIEVILLNSHN